MKYLLYLFIFLSGICYSQGNKSSYIAYTANNTVKQYIPLNIVPFDSTAGSQSRYVKYFSRSYNKYLSGLNEPILFKDTSDTETIRFTWLRTSAKPIIIRAEKKGNSIMLYSKLNNGLGGYVVGDTTEENSLTLTSKQWQQALALLDKLDIKHVQPLTNELGNDGAMWLIEYSTKENYYFTSQWTPKRGLHKKACMYLLGLSALKIEKGEIY